MCEGESYCMPKAEILQWLAGKYVVLLYNEVRFVTNKFGSEALAKEARISYVPISTQSRQLIPFEMGLSNVGLQDNLYIELGDLTLETRTDLFRLN
mmetsp:Transcript_35517/g.43513  ORF Transcript_35517/g.43513 Transcript_35517/m.43513 type:complete len:96 (+) Transcript_35517:676-963(+)